MPREKLVRDRIPEIIRENGEHCEIDRQYRKAAPEEMKDLLIAKLREEVEEYAANPSVGELADIGEVLLALALNHNVPTWRALGYVLDDKRNRRGGFWERFVLFMKE